MPGHSASKFALNFSDRNDCKKKQTSIYFDKTLLDCLTSHQTCYAVVLAIFCMYSLCQKLRQLRYRGVHRDGILVPCPPIPADFTPIPTRPHTDSDPARPSPQKVRSIPTSPRIFFVNQRR